MKTKQRQLEIYHLIPNTTYEFRIWANNALGAGEVVTITATTLPDMEEKGRLWLWIFTLTSNHITNPNF